MPEAGQSGPRAAASPNRQRLGAALMPNRLSRMEAMNIGAHGAPDSSGSAGQTPWSCRMNPAFPCVGSDEAPCAALWQHSQECLRHRVGVGELAGSFFAVNALAVVTHLKHPAAGRHEAQRTQLLLEREELSRQTDGLGFIVSGRAILDDDFRFCRHAPGP